MAKRTKAELLKEFDRLREIFDLCWEYQLDHMSPDQASEFRTLVQTREETLAEVESGKVTLSQVVAGTREAINDQQEMLGFAAEEDFKFFTDFLSFYFARTGRHYYDDAGYPRKMARTIFKRGLINDDTEYRFINGILSNVDQRIFKSDEIGRVNEMLSAFLLGDDETDRLS